VTASGTHLVLIPSFNTGRKLVETIEAARSAWNPVWVVIDGSSDGSEQATLAMAERDPGLTVMIRAANGGQGAALYDGLKAAAAAGFTHVLTMDADGQHPPERIGAFMAESKANPRAMVLGRPIFDASAPLERLAGRRLANLLARLASSFADIGDCLCGFRVYPLSPLLAAMGRTRHMRGFDFDPEAAIRLAQAGLPIINLPAEIRYFRPAEGGVSHFRYWRDNLVLAHMYLRLVGSSLIARRRAHRIDIGVRAEAGRR